MRNIQYNDIKTCFVIPHSLYDFIVTMQLGDNIWAKYVEDISFPSDSTDFQAIKEQIYHAVANFFGIDEVTAIYNGVPNTKIIFFKDSSVTDKLPTENFSIYQERISVEQNDCADALKTAIITGTLTDANVRQKAVDLIIALCADKNDLYHINKRYGTNPQLKIIIDDICKRTADLIAEYDIDVETKLILNAAADIMNKQGIETCQPYFVGRNPWQHPDDNYIPCYMAGHCKNKHCTCPHM